MLTPAEQQQIEAHALTVRCPRCGRQAGIPCYSYHRHQQVPAHPSRLAMAHRVG